MLAIPTLVYIAQHLWHTLNAHVAAAGSTHTVKHYLCLDMKIVMVRHTAFIFRHMISVPTLHRTVFDLEAENATGTKKGQKKYPITDIIKAGTTKSYALWNV